MEVKDMTTDQLLELLAWVRDRAAYRRACQQPIDGADIPVLYAAMDELDALNVLEQEISVYRRLGTPAWKAQEAKEEITRIRTWICEELAARS